MEYPSSWQINGSNKYVPLKKVEFTGNINECFGEFTVEQKYVNTNEKLLEVEYVFPLNHTSSITDVTLQMGSRLLKSSLIEKQEARKEYTKAIEDKHKALLLEKTNLGYKIKVGNIEPNEELIVRYTYVSTVDYSNGKYRLIIQTNIAPHYTLQNKNLCIRGNDSNIKYDNKNDIEFNVNVNWKTTNKIDSFESLTHPRDCVIKKCSDIEYCIEMKSTGLTKDFNLLCVTGESISQQYYDDGKYTYGMHTIKLDNTDTKLKPEQYTHIFMIDCSGSMASSKIQQAKDALTLFIRSLEVGSNYNIIKFGDTFSKFYEKNVVYNEQNQLDTLEKIKDIAADMGGTEILKPIYYLLDSSIESNHIANIFLLTDGQVSNNDQIINTIKSKKKDNLRFFVIGFGSDADRNLCERIANQGCGMCNMAIDDTNLKQILIQQYTLSRQEYYFNVDFIFDQTTICTYNSSRCVLPNKVYKIFTRTPTDKFKELKELKITYNIGSTRTQETKIFQLNNPTESNKLIKILFACDMIRNIEDGFNQYNINLVDLSVENKVMCSKTSFLVVDCEKKITSDLKLTTKSIQHYSNQEMYDPLNLLPQSNDKDWFEVIDKPINLKGRLLRLENPLGINTVSDTLKVPNLDLRPVPLCREINGSPWNNSTVEPDTNIKTLDSGYYRPLPKTVDELRKFNKPNISHRRHRSTKLYDSQMINPKKKSDIMDFQQFNGCIKYDEDVLTIIGITYNELKNKALLDKCGILITFNRLVKEYLSKYPEYILILRKFNDYLNKNPSLI
jgi:hypothetical protein